MHIYTVTVARLYIIIIISNFALFFSLFSICTTNTLIIIICFFLWYTHSYSQNQKSTTKIKNQPQNQQQNHLETPQNQTHPHMDTPTETERVDRNLWQIGMLGSAFFSPCLDRSSSRRAWIRDRESGLALVADRRAWIGVHGSAFFSSCLDRSSSRRSAPCLDWKFRKFGIERSENLGIERSFRETLEQSLVSGEKERGSWVEREGLR